MVLRYVLRHDTAGHKSAVNKFKLFLIPVKILVQNSLFFLQTELERVKIDPADGKYPFISIQIQQIPG